MPFDVVGGRTMARAPGAVSLKVDGAVLPLQIADLPTNTYAPGALLRHVAATQQTNWKAITNGLPAVLETLKATTMSTAAAEVLAALADVVPALDVLIDEFVVTLPATLDGDRLALVERVLLANGLTIPASASSAPALAELSQAPAGRLAQSTLAGDQFLQDRAVYAQISNNLGHFALYFNAAALACPECKLGEAIVSLTSVTADLAIGSLHGAVTDVTVTAAHDPIPVTGSTANATIRVEKTLSILNLASFYLKLGDVSGELETIVRTVGLPKGVADAAVLVSDALSAVDRYISSIPGSIAAGQPQTLPVSFSLLEPSMKYSKLAFDQAGHIDVHIVPRRDTEDAEFRLQPHLRTTSEGRVVGRRTFRVEQPRGRVLHAPAVDPDIHGPRGKPGGEPPVVHGGRRSVCRSGNDLGGDCRSALDPGRG